MISVIIPAYNCEASIKRCLCSVLAQSYEELEAIVVNDGSTDGTEAAVNSIAAGDPRVKLINQANAGVSAARNRGIEAAAGEFVCFVDSDDHVAQTYLEQMADVYEPGTLVAVNYLINDAPALTQTTDKSTPLPEKNALADAYLVGDVGSRIAYSVWNKLFLRQTLTDKHICFRSDLSVGEDMVFVFEYLKACDRITTVYEPLYHYVFHPNSAVNTAKVDFAPKYELLYGALREACIGYTNDQRKLTAAWSLRIMPYVLFSGYAAGKTYQEFKRYYRELLSYQFVSDASSERQKTGRKEALIRMGLRRNSPFVLYSLVRLSALKNKIRK